MKKFYITTSLPYVNDAPHIGFGLEILQADVLARYQRAKGNTVFFLTGTDEHGTKIEKTAAQKETTPKKLADQNSKAFKDLKKVLNLSWDDFIRTTDQKNHWPGVLKIWEEMQKSGDIYKKTYRGLYCSGCEMFLNEKDMENGKCIIHHKEPELVEEENYFFRLSVYSKTLKNKIESGDMKISPQWRANEILALMDKGLEDVSFSRPKSKLSWGIPVPGDDSQVMYVWADALTNYISAIGYGRDDEEFNKWWPAEVQVIGKDILRFHAAIWPAMLLSAKLPLPKNILVHGFINVDGQKMSKSLGNVVAPKDLTEKFGIDPIRYYFLREFSSFDDGDYSQAKFRDRYNGDLAKGLGNFTSRVLTLADSFGNIKNDFSLMELSLEHRIKSVQKEVDDCLYEFKFNDALASIWSLISTGDQYINEQKPWDKNNTPVQIEKALYNLLMILNAVSVLLSPFMPETAKKIYSAITFKGKNVKIKKVGNLFPRID